MIALDKVFSITYGVNLELCYLTIDDSEDAINFVSRTKSKNGVSARVSRVEGIDPNPGNTISVAMTGSVLEAFYQKDEYYSGRDIAYLTPLEEMDVWTMFAYCTCIRANQYKYSYGRGANTTLAQLPVPDRNEIMAFMPLCQLPDIKTIPDYFLDDGYDEACWYIDNIDQKDFEENYAGSMSRKRNLQDVNWDLFRLGDIVDDVHNGKSYNASDLVVSDTEDYVAYVTRTDQNNGIAMYAQNLDYPGKEKAGAITIGDTTATAFYQTVDFITGPHIIVVRASWFNIYTALFIISILNLEKYRYPVFGRAFTKELIQDTMLYLPKDEKGNPDYQYMEAYIKGCSFSCNIE